MNRSLNIQLVPFLKKTALRRGAIFGSILITALLAFEIFNFSTTSYALNDMLGNLAFAGVKWSTVLAIAFCGIDFAGIARIFTPEQGRDEPAEVWYLFGAWLLAAAFNASLTWWGVSVAIMQNQSPDGAMLVGQSAMTSIVPVFVAGMVWLIRVLIIGTFSVAGERLFSLADARAGQVVSNFQGYSKPATPQPRPYQAPQPRNIPAAATSFRPSPKPAPVYTNLNRPNTEPTYHPIGMSASAPRNESGNNSLRR